MNKHASMNRAFRLVWNEARAAWVPAAETTRGRGKRGSRASRTAVLLAPLLGTLALAEQALAAPPTATVPATRAAIVSVAVTHIKSNPAAAAVQPIPTATTLPTGGTVVAGSATISQTSSSSAPVLTVDQTTERAVIDWNTFNVGSAAQVNFEQPNAQAVTLDRVLSGSPSEIFGKITAPGQVFLTNPNGVYFAKSASVDVGGLVATTGSIDTADFMAGNVTVNRNGATGSVVNEGTLKSSLGGYIALLAPEVRNGGVIVARMGTVALAAGDSVTLDFDGSHLTGITATPSTIATLVENRSAVLAPGGLIILSAQAADALQGGVVKNSGTLAATGLAEKGGRIMLEASTSVDNTGTISANAGTDGSPAGSVAVTAPTITNSGSITATAITSSSPATAAGAQATQPAQTPQAARAAQTAGSVAANSSTTPGGQITLTANTITQSPTGVLDVTGVTGGTITLDAQQSITLAGRVSAVGIDSTLAPTAATSVTAPVYAATPAKGGTITLATAGDITLQNVLLDVSGITAGGTIEVEAGGTPTPSAPPGDPPTLALLGTTELDASGRKGKGGAVTLTANTVNLLDTSSIDASGALGGGTVYVGGGFHGQNPSVVDAQQVSIGTNVVIDASAIQSGDGGNVAVWSSGQTQYAGQILARGGATTGDGGYVEVSGKGNLDFTGTVNAGATHGVGGTLLLDPEDITIDASGSDAVASEVYETNPGSASIIAPATITAITNNGTSVQLEANNNIIVNSSIQTVAAGGTGGAIEFDAGNSITINASIISDNGAMTFSANNASADPAFRQAGTATFTNNSLIDAGTGAVNITMGTQGAAGNISTGQITAGSLTITHNGTTAGNTINLGETDLTGNLSITTAASQNVTNTIGTITDHGTTSIDVGTGNVTITNPNTDFTLLGLTAGAVSLINKTAVEFTTVDVASLSETTQGPIASTGAIVVSGLASFTADNGGFGFEDPYVGLTNSGNHFGSLALSVTSTGTTGTGGYANIVDSAAADLVSSTTATALTLQAGGTVTTGSVQAGSFSLTSKGAVSLGTTTVGGNLTISTTSDGGVTTTGALNIGSITTIAAGAANDIVLTNAANQLNVVQISSGDNVSLVDLNTLTFYPSTISGNLAVTAGGNIQQSGNGSPITVDGSTTFTANGTTAQINLLLGTTNPFNPGTGSANDFVGPVTLAVASGNTTSGFSLVELRNISATASVLNGLTSVGTLTGVYLTYDDAPSVTLPGMTVNGNLSVYAPDVQNTATVPANIISQTGSISVTGQAMFMAASTGDVTLTNPTNSFNDLGVIQARNASIVNQGAIVLYAPGYNQTMSGNLTVTAGGNISDLGNSIYVQTGTASFNSGTANVSLTQNNVWDIVEFPAANNVTLYPYTGVTLGASTIAGTLTVSSHNPNSAALGEVAGAAVDMTTPADIATFTGFVNGISLTSSGNVFGPLAISNSGAIAITENDAITEASAWSNYNTSTGVGYTVALTTTNNQAITLNQSGNYLGALTITQNGGPSGTAGAVYIRDTANSNAGLTEGATGWTVNGPLEIDSGTYSINLNNPNNILGPLQVTASAGTTNTVASSVTIYAKNTASTSAITDVGSAGAWNTGTDVVKLIAYDTTGAVAGGGNIDLENPANVIGALYLKGNNVTITENGSITDGPSTSWDTAGDTGWVTTGVTDLVVANPTGKSINLANLTNLIGPIAISTTGATGTLTSVLITNDQDITQSGAWNVGAAPVTLDPRTFAVDLTNPANVLGDINITTSNGTPTSITITENDAITQGSPWVLTGVPVTLVAEAGNPITLTSATNIIGNLTLTGGAVSVTENANITQGGAWTTTGTTTLNPTASGITLTNSGNVLGPIAIAGTPSAVSITEAADITQASAWVQSATPFTLNSGTSDIVLSQANNQLGALTLTGANATVVENNTGGITEGGAWNIPGTTTLAAGSANPIILEAIPSSNLGTVNIQSAAYADIFVAGGVNFSGATIATGGTLTVSAGNEITQSGAIVAPSLRLIGDGYASLTNSANSVGSIAAGFSGGDLAFTNNGDFSIAVIGGTSGVTIGSGNVALTSVNGTITGLTNVNPSSGSLTVSTGTALTLPQMAIAGPQSYTASTVSGAGITLTAGITSTALGAIAFNSPVTLDADVTVQSKNSDITFAGTVTGANYQLSVNAGSGTVLFDGAVSALGNTTDASAALTIQSSGADFVSTLGANNGLAITGPVTFNDTVTLADGSAASVFTGLVTLGAPGGMSLSGYKGMSFDDGVLLQNGAATIDSNDSPLNFQTAGTVSGPYALTLDSGTALITGLDRMGTNLTGLTVTALSPTIPSGGIAIAGPQSYTATSGSTITLSGNVTSTAAGEIDFNSPVTVGAAVAVASTDSPIVFASTVDGARNLSVNAGTGATTFTGAVGGLAPLGSGTGAALTLQGSGTTTFDSTVQARSGISATSPVTFDGNVTLTAGDTGSTFAGLVTAGGTTGITLSGYGGIAFNGGLALTGGPESVVSNGSAIGFGGAVSGAENLTLNALAAGAGTVTGLQEIGSNSNLTALNITAESVSLPSTGLAVAGPMSFTATGGITLNGAVGGSGGGSPATGQISFNGPVALATGAVAVTTANAPVTFAGTVDGAEALNVNAGTAATTFSQAVGATTVLTSLTTGSGATAINGGSVSTTGAQSYGGAVALGANSTLAGDDVQFASTLDGAHALIVNDTGTTTFDGVVGGATPLTSMYINAPDAVTIDSPSITTTGSQTYIGATMLATNTVLNAIGITFDGIVDGAYTLTANAGSGTLNFEDAVGSVTPLAALTGNANNIDIENATTAGAQNYTALVGLSLGGTLSTTNSGVTLTGATTLTADSAIDTTGGNINFSGAASTVNGDFNLSLAAGTGNVTLGGVVGGTVALAGISLSGYDLTIPDVTTVNDANQTYTALDNITLTQSRTLDAPISFTADSDGDGNGSFILLSGVSLTASNSTLSITAADINLQGSSTLSSGTGLMTLTATDDRNIYLGGTTTAPGQMTITGSELSRISTSGGLELKTTGSGWIDVNGITSTESQNVTGPLALDATGTGNIGFITAASTFNAVTADATGGQIDVGVNLTAQNHAIEFVTPVSVSGASTISSGGGNITFDSTVSVDNNLILSTGNGALAFDGAVGSTSTLTVNLGGGSVSGLAELQSTLTGLTVNGTGSITLPPLSIDGPQVYETGPITITGDMSGIGLTFGNAVSVVPTSGTAVTLNAGTGALDFGGVVAFHAIDMTLTADAMTLSDPATGTGNLVMQPYTSSANVAVGGSGAPITGLNLTAADLAALPLNTFASVTIGNDAGTGSLDLAGALNASTTPLTLNGGGGITQSGGALTSGALSLYAAGNAINLPNAPNSFGAVALDGTPSAVTLTNTQNIVQQGSAAWNLGSADLTLNAATHNIILTNAGNTFGTLSLTGANAQVDEAADTDIGVSTLSGGLTVSSSGAINVSGALAAGGNVSFTAAGEVTQSAPLTIGGDLSVVTSINAGDVTINNSGATATTIGNTDVGGNYTLTATGEPVSQAAGTSVQVVGNLTITGQSVDMSGAGNLVGGTTMLPASNTVVIDESGVINLAANNYTGNLTVISERTNRSFGSAEVNGNAIVLNDSSNKIGGTISVNASAPTVTTGADVQTGITQLTGSLSVAGVASFTAEASTAGSLGITLTNAGNNFGALQVSGTTVNVANASTGVTTLANSAATTSLTLTTAGAVAQSGSIATPALSITADGAVTLGNVANAISSVSVSSGGNPIAIVNSSDLSVASLNAGGSTVSLTTEGTGNLTQTGALQNVTALNVAAGGAVTLDDTSNEIQTLGASTAGSGFYLYNSGGSLAVTGAVATATAGLTVRTIGDLTLASGGTLAATTGNLVVSTEGAGNFINDSTAAGSALVVGSGGRWLVYSDTPDLVSGAHTVKGGLTSAFRAYDATYSSYAPGSVTQSGNGFIYDYATPTLTVSAIINGTPSQVYGSTPTATLGYTISSGAVDSEDNASNVITGGTATYSMALTNSLNAGTYSISYTGGLTSSYTLLTSPTGATYTVTPAVLTYTATPVSRGYGAANPTFGGTISGFQLGQTASVLGGSPTWTTTATTASDVGQYAITGSGYTSSGNYTFAQAPANATALTIGQAALTITASDAETTYNGMNFSGGNGVSYSGFMNTDSASSLGGSLAYTGTSQGARNAGTYTITPSGLTSGNYAITYDSGTLTIDKANLTITTADVSRAYNGTLAAAGTAVATGGTQVFGSDTLTGGTYAFTNANAGTGDKTVTVSGVSVNDGNAGNNYTVNYVSNTTSTITPAAISVEASNVTKTYDGTTTATSTPTLVSGALYQNVSNGNAPDSISGGTFAFADPNAGVGDKTVTTSGVTVNDGNGGGNYAVTYLNNTTSTINPATLTYTATIADKTYDGTTAASVGDYTLTGLVGNQTLVADAGTATFSDPNAGTNKPVSIGGIALANGTNGGLASNYVVNSTSSSTGTIDPKQLTVNVAIDNKVYDGTTAAVVDSYGLSGFVGNQTVGAVYAGSAAFASKDVGTAVPVSITGIELTNGTNGGIASNYSVAPTVMSSANITPATLQIAGLIPQNKVYDGTTTAYFNTGSAVLSGLIGSDAVQIGTITGTFATKNVGTSIPIGAGTVVLSGADALDYTLVQPTNLSADITPRALAVSATGVNKVYDGTANATVALTDSPLAGDSVTANYGSATFTDKNAGTGKFVGVSGITLTGADAEDYTVNTSATTFASITPASLVVSAAGVNKVYDGTTAATVTLSDTPIAGDVVDLTYGAANFATKDVGDGKTVTVSGITVTGADAADYAVSTTATTTANITPSDTTPSAPVASSAVSGTWLLPPAQPQSSVPGSVTSVPPLAASPTPPADVLDVSMRGGSTNSLASSGSGATGAFPSASAQNAAGTAAPSGAGGASNASTAAAIAANTAAINSAYAEAGASANAANAATSAGADAAGAAAAGSTASDAGAAAGSIPSGDALVDNLMSGPLPEAATEKPANKVDQNISVSVSRTAAQTLAGVVTVLVPRSVIDTAVEFRFPLPTQVSGALAKYDGTQDVRVTRMNGKPLPSWLKFRQERGLFVASSMPMNALPLEVLVRTPAESWIVVISEKND